MNGEMLRQKAEAFLGLHEDASVLVLPNAWDAVSAKLFEKEGFKAVGTTSAGISSSLGYPDGERMSLEENISVVRCIVRAVDLPVSVDIEAGYADTTEGVVRSAREVLKAGAVGLNLEDGTGDPARPLFDLPVMKERVRAIREMTVVEEVPLVLNARTDVYLLPGEKSEKDLKHAVERGNAYREAGADCIFVPDLGDLDKESIARLVREIEAPLNIIAGATTPPIPELREIGVSRLSLGPRPMRAMLALLRRISREILVGGTYHQMTDETLAYAEINQWFESVDDPKTR